MLRMYRDTLSLLGPVLPVVSFLGRLPTAMCQLGSLLLVAETSGSLATAGLTGGALAAGQTVAGPLARTRSVALARRSDGCDERLVGAVLSFEGTLDEVSFVLGPALVGLAAALAHPAAALLLAALLLAGCGTAFALHPTARATAPGAPATTTRTSAAERTRLPGSAYALRGTMVLQGAMFGASQAGITALTEKLGAPAQAGLVYAAMGVMSAAVGLSLAAVPARIGLTTRWRAATAGLVVLSVPLLFVGSLGALYAVVVVLGAAYAPHLITVFGLTERTVPAARLAESMAFLTSGIVGGQALALALSGRLAEGHGAPAAFAVAVGAAVACALLSWTVRADAPVREVRQAVAARSD